MANAKLRYWVYGASVRPYLMNLSLEHAQVLRGWHLTVLVDMTKRPYYQNAPDHFTYA